MARSRWRSDEELAPWVLDLVLRVSQQNAARQLGTSPRRVRRIVHERAPHLVRGVGATIQNSRRQTRTCPCGAEFIPPYRSNRKFCTDACREQFTTGRRCYDLRAQGLKWRDVAAAVGYAMSNCGSCWRLARDHARRVGRPWPPRFEEVPDGVERDTGVDAERGEAAPAPAG